MAARPRPAPARALGPAERQHALELLHTRFADQAPAQVHATLLDEGTYLCSPRTMYRLLDAVHEIKERRNQVRRPHDAALPRGAWLRLQNFGGFERIVEDARERTRGDKRLGFKHLEP